MPLLRTRIKICGVRDAATARAAAEAGADAIGLVFAAGSPRQVSLAEAQEILHHLPLTVEPVGLFVDESMEQVQAIADVLRLRTVQLHGHERAEDASRLSNLRVIRALPFDDAEQVEAQLATWREHCPNLAGFLFDAPPPSDSALTGGSGQTFDWQQLAHLRERGALAGRAALCLAGGLRADNVGAAIATVHPYLVDVSSGVESSRGVKNAKLIEAFCCAVHDADAAYNSA